jgi:hypothetical protein
MRNRSAWPRLFSITSSSASTDPDRGKTAICSNQAPWAESKWFRTTQLQLDVGGNSEHNFARDERIFCI